MYVLFIIKIIITKLQENLGKLFISRRKLTINERHDLIPLTYIMFSREDYEPDTFRKRKNIKVGQHYKYICFRCNCTPHTSSQEDNSKFISLSYFPFPTDLIRVDIETANILSLIIMVCFLISRDRGSSSIKLISREC